MPLFQLPPTRKYSFLRQLVAKRDSPDGFYKKGDTAELIDSGKPGSTHWLVSIAGRFFHVEKENFVVSPTSPYPNREVDA